MFQLLQEIQMAYSGLSQAQKSVASYVLENYKDIPFLSVTSLAREIGVSETTIIKFCMQMGYNGYGTFKRTLSEYVQSEMTMYNNLEVRSEGISEHDTLDKTIACDIANIQQTLGSPLNRANFDKLLELIEKAKRIYVLGFRSSALLAQYMALTLRQQDRDVHAIIPGIGEYVDKLSKVTPDDLLIAVTFSRYSREVVKAVNLLNSQGVPCVLITDTPANPIYPKADLVFSCETKSFNYASSFVGCMSLMNAIFTATSLGRKQVTKDYLKKLEDMFSQFDTFSI